MGNMSGGLKVNHRTAGRNKLAYRASDSEVLSDQFLDAGSWPPPFVAASAHRYDIKRLRVVAVFVVVRSGATIDAQTLFGGLQFAKPDLFCDGVDNLRSGVVQNFRASMVASHAGIGAASRHGPITNDADQRGTSCAVFLVRPRRKLLHVAPVPLVDAGGSEPITSRYKDTRAVPAVYFGSR